MSFVGETVTILSRTEGGVDRYGKPTYTWPAPGTAVPSVIVAPGTSTEGNEAIRKDVDTACTLYQLPYDVTVGPYDRVIVRGVTWQVDGDAERWSNGTWQPGSVLALKKVEG